MKSHGRVHKEEKTHQCKTCEKFFKTSPELIRHEKLHIGEKQFECPICGKAFVSKASLRIHGFIHSSNGKPYKCQFCVKSFFNSSGLKKHERNHTGEKPYQCQTCEKSFTAGSYLRRHERIHELKIKAKSHECKICGKIYKDTSGLYYHRLKHSGEKPYYCQICGEGITNRLLYKKHVRIHELNTQGK